MSDTAAKAGASVLAGFGVADLLDDELVDLSYEEEFSFFSDYFSSFFSSFYSATAAGASA